MASTSGRPEGPPQAKLLPDVVFGTALFVIVEAMLFGGFISAFTIAKAAYVPGTWPPPDQPRLPVEATAVTSLMLLASGAALWWSGRRFDEDRAASRRALDVATLLGAVFIGVQGFEWARLLAEGLTLRSSPYGSFFYVIVGTHALHAIPSLGVLVWARLKLGRDQLREDVFWAARLFWYFVVLVWPVLYWKVYL